MYVANDPGIAAQNNPNPHSIFADHAFAVVNGTYYDPSYGKTFSTLKQFDDEAIDGYFFQSKKVIDGNLLDVFFIRKNDTSKVDLMESSRTTY